jgi:hypothetical protein
MYDHEPVGADPPLANAEIGIFASIRPVDVSHCGAIEL